MLLPVLWLQYRRDVSETEIEVASVWLMRRQRNEATGRARTSKDIICQERKEV